MVDFYGESGTPVREQREDRGTETAQPGAEELNLDGAKLRGVALTPEEIVEAREFIRLTPPDAPLAELRERYREKFGDSPIPKEVVDAVVNAQDTRITFNMMKLFMLAQIRGAEILPWIEPLLKAEEPVCYGNAACGLLYIDEARGIKEVVRLYELCAWTGKRQSGFCAEWFVIALEELGTPACMEAIERIRKLERHIVWVRYRAGDETEQ
jgi:hypothetical protein